MPRLLLSDALAYAEHADQPVSAAIWLRASRVMASFDRDAAARLLEAGITSAQRLEPDGRRPLMHTAVSVGATVAPARALAIAAKELSGSAQAGALWMAFHNMLDLGMRDEVAALLIDFPPALPFPYGNTIEATNPGLPQSTRRGIVQAAVRAFRRAGADARAGFAESEFVRLINARWRLLPPDEARDVVHALVQAILTEPDSATHSGGNDVRFSSTRQFRLFELLGPLRRLDSDLATSLIAQHPQLARGAAVMPYGYQMFGEEPDPPVEPPTPARRRVFGHARTRLGQDSGSMPTDPGLGARLAKALQLFERDANGGNGAPNEVWPSTGEFRSALYQAGAEQGRSATVWLDQVPDPDLRCLASIELAAALADLPQIGGMSISPGPRRAPTPRLEDLPADVRAMVEAHMAKARYQPPPLPVRPNLAPSTDARIAPAAQPPGARMAGGAGLDFWSLTAVPLRPLFSKLYDVPDTRLELPADLAAGRYDIALVLAGDASHETMKALMRESLVRHFDLDVALEPTPTDVYVMTAPAGLKARPAVDDRHAAGMSMSSVSFSSRIDEDDRLEWDAYDVARVMDLHIAGEDLGEAALSRHMGSPGQLSGLNGAKSLPALADTLEQAFGRPVLDETGLSGSYEMNVETEGKGDFLTALRDTLGVVVTPARRDVPTLIVRKRSR